MLHQPTIEKLLAMHLEPMVETWRNFEQNQDAAQLSFEEKLSLMVDRLWTWRQNLALERRLRYAKLKGNACVEDIDYRASRGLDRTLIRSLVNDSGWVSRHENIFLVGPTGVGKSWLACALAQKTCRDGYLVLYTRAAALFRDLALARADGSQRNLLARLSRVDVLVVDDWAMAPMQESERRDFWEICEERYQTRSTILTSQVPVVQWHEQIGDATIADGILDRLVHNAHRIELRGESMRKTRAKKTESKEEKRNLTTRRCWQPKPLLLLKALVWGKGLQTPAPSPTPPSPLHNKIASLRSENNSSSLTISITSRDNQSRQRRCAPTLIGIAGTLIAFTLNP